LHFKTAHSKGLTGEFLELRILKKLAQKRLGHEDSAANTASMHLELFALYNSMNRKHVNASIFRHGVAALTQGGLFGRLVCRRVPKWNGALVGCV